MDIKPGFSGDIIIKILNIDFYANLCDMTITTVGDNLPCVNVNTHFNFSDIGSQDPNG